MSQPLDNASRSDPPEAERFIGCLLGQGIGDALGTPFTGRTRLEIAKTRGDFNQYMPRVDRDGNEISAAGQVSANTELALCLLETLVSTGGFVDPASAGYRFLQVLESENAHLLGTITRAALERARETWEFQQGIGGPGSAGTGPAARIAPVALVHALGRLNSEVLVREVMRSALITHAAPESINGALAIAWALILLVRRETLPSLLISEVLSFIDEDDVAKNLRRAEQKLLTRRGPSDDVAALDVIGTSGWVAEAVPAALYLVEAYGDDFRGAVRAAASAGGASDAIGAMVGGLLGAWVGASALPVDLVEGLASRMYILMATPALYRVAQRRAGLFLQLHQR